MEVAGAEVREGLVRQRRSVVAASLLLVAFQEVGAKVDHLEFLGNTVALSRPLALTVPLWLLWAYFLLRYYQHFHDVGDTGFQAAVRERERALVRRAALAKLRNTLQPEAPGEHADARSSIEVLSFDILSEPPGFWQLKAKGWIHFRDPARPAWASAQILDHELVLAPGTPRYSKIRAVCWAGFHTRFFTEYGLPFVVAALPPTLLVLHRLGWHLLV